MKAKTILTPIAALAALVLTCGPGAVAQTKTGTVRPTQTSFIRTPIGSSEMTVELPGKAEKITVPLSESIRTSYDILETIGVTSPELATFASYAVSRGNKPISLDGAARGALDKVKDQAQAQDYRESITNVTVVGLPGRRIGCTFTAGGKKMFLSGVIFTDRTRMWQVIATGVQSAPNTNISQRVLASVKRQDKPGGPSPAR